MSENTFTQSGDIKFFYKGPEKADMRIDGVDLLRDPGLENGALISIFTDGRADDDDKLPHNTDDLRGWWGDAYLETPFPSRLWLLDRATISSTSEKEAEQYISDALEWMILDGLADEVEVMAARGGTNQMNFSITISKTSGTTIFFKWFVNWNSQIFGGL